MPLLPILPMTPKILQKYSVAIQIPSHKKTKAFFDLAKKHIIKTGGKKESLAINADKVLYGKK